MATHLMSELIKSCITVQLGGKKWDLGVTGLARLCSFLEDVSSLYSSGGKKWDLGVTGPARLCSFLEDVSSRYGYIQTVLRGREFCFLIFLGF